MNPNPGEKEHLAAKRARRRRQKPPQFDENAKEANDAIMRQHEFRRENIREVEFEDKDLFEYDPEDKERYTALSFEHLFQFGTTFKAIKWGVFVGSLFGFHRYYRSRDMNNATHWFTVMSFVSFFNIWISYAIQDFVTDYGVRKSVSLQQRNEYHGNFYKAYLDNRVDNVKPIENKLKVQPIFNNSQAQSLFEFVEKYDEFLVQKYRTDLPENKEGVAYDLRKDMEENNLLNKPMDEEKAKNELLEAIKRVEDIDLTSFDFSRDPDNCYSIQ